MGMSAIGTGLAIALTSGAQLYAGRKQRKAMKEAEAARTREADRLFNLQEEEMRKQEERLNEQKAKAEKEEQDMEKSQKRDNAAARRRKRERGAGGRSSTILTGAQGIQDDQEKGRTLLGV